MSWVSDTEVAAEGLPQTGRRPHVGADEGVRPPLPLVVVTRVEDVGSVPEGVPLASTDVGVLRVAARGAPGPPPVATPPPLRKASVQGLDSL